MHFDFTEVCNLMNIFREIITESGLHPISLVRDLSFLPLLNTSPALASKAPNLSVNFGSALSVFLILPGEEWKFVDLNAFFIFTMRLVIAD